MQTILGTELKVSSLLLFQPVCSINKLLTYQNYNLLLIQARGVMLKVWFQGCIVSVFQ